MNIQSISFLYFTSEGEKVSVSIIVDPSYDLHLATWKITIEELATNNQYGHYFFHSNSIVPLAVESQTAVCDYIKDLILTGDWRKPVQDYIANWSDAELSGITLGWTALQNIGFRVVNDNLAYKRKNEAIEIERDLLRLKILEAVEERNETEVALGHLYNNVPFQKETVKKECFILYDEGYLAFGGTGTVENPTSFRITAEGRRYLEILESDMDSAQKNKPPKVQVIYHTKLSVFISYAKEDISTAQDLYQKLLDSNFVDPWLDVENLLPGQDWDLEIKRAIRSCGAIIVCLSNNSIDKEGYFQKEIVIALDEADKKPPGTIYIIPLRLEDCEVPERLHKWQWVDHFEENGMEKLRASLLERLKKLEQRK